VIAFLRGRVIEKRPNRLVIDVQGVGYDVQVPLSTFYQAGEPPAEIALRIHTHVREDTLALFGFATELELQIFERLIAVGGIGPKVAIGVLSGIEPLDLIRAVQAGDIGRLTAIPGVGKKTAERIGLELKDRLPPAAAVEAGGEGRAREDGLSGDVLSALVNLGYHRPLAEQAVGRAVRSLASPTFEQALREALRELAR
jgi:Holliday junction DNA helicase RuvA